MTFEINDIELLYTFTDYQSAVQKGKKMLFEKKTLVYRKRDRETWSRIKAILKDAGIKGVSAGRYMQERIPVGGYSMMDPRDYGPNGRIDRNVYFIRVRESQAAAALDAIRAHAVTAEVMSDEELSQDAPDRHPVKHSD